MKMVWRGWQGKCVIFLPKHVQMFAHGSEKHTEVKKDLVSYALTMENKHLVSARKKNKFCEKEKKSGGGR
jgi:hypothetical protein